jgi:hypothetical protein
VACAAVKHPNAALRVHRQQAPAEYARLVSDRQPSRHLSDEWTRWVGRGNGRVAAMIVRPIEIVVSVIESFSALPSDFFPSTVRGRVRHCRRGGYEAITGAWREDGQPLRPVSVVLSGDDLFVEGDTFVVSLSALTPIGILDYPTRPRATTASGAELVSGVVVRVGEQVAELLLSRKSELAVVAILAGWRAPADLVHGQTAAEVLGATS